MVFLADYPAPGQKRGKATEYWLSSKMPVNFTSLPVQIYSKHFSDPVVESHETRYWLRMIDNALYGPAQVEHTNAKFEFTNAVFVFSVAKSSLVRAVGCAAEILREILRPPRD